MTAPTPRTTTTSEPRRGRWLRPLQLGAAAVALAAAGLAVASPHGFGHGEGRHAMMGGMGGMGGYGMDGRHAERLLDEIKATPEQRTQLRAIWDAARKDLKAQREAAPQLHQQLQQLMAAPTVDARAVEQLRQQMMARHDQASQRMAQAMLDASRVLTPEQRQQLAQRMEQRRALMERHRQERQQLDGGPSR